MNKLIMRVGDVIKVKNKSLYSIVGAEIEEADTRAIKSVTLVKGNKRRKVSISEVQTSTSLIGKRNLFLITTTPVAAAEVNGAEVFAEI